MTTSSAAPARADLGLTHALYLITLATVDACPGRDSKRDGGYRVWLWEAQEGRCFDCAEFVDFEDAEYAHIHRAPRGGIMMPGLGGMACRDCNIIHNIVADDNGSIPWEYMSRRGVASRVVVGIPNPVADRAAMVSLHTARVATVHAERVAEAARRMA